MLPLYLYIRELWLGNIIVIDESLINKKKMKAWQIKGCNLFPNEVGGQS